MRNNIAWLAAMILFLVATVSCASQATATPSPEELLAQSAEAMQRVESLRFAIERIGEPVQIDQTLGASLLSAMGEYDATDGVHVAARVDIGGTAAELQMLWVADGMYIQFPPLMPAYTQPPGGDMAFDAATIFDPESGLPYILTESLQNPAIIGIEQVEEFETYHLAAQANSEDLATLTGGVVTGEDVATDVWIEIETSRVVRINLAESERSGYLIDFYAFNEPMDIPSP